LAAQLANPRSTVTPGDMPGDENEIPGTHHGEVDRRRRNRGHELDLKSDALA
jgi:hypothetical protein